VHATGGRYLIDREHWPSHVSSLHPVGAEGRPPDPGARFLDSLGVRDIEPELYEEEVLECGAHQIRMFVATC
jgi:hypothetical protein